MHLDDNRSKTALEVLDRDSELEEVVLELRLLDRHDVVLGILERLDRLCPREVLEICTSKGTKLNYVEAS